MKNKTIFIITTAILFISCSKDINTVDQATIGRENAAKVLGFNIDPNHDWCTTTTGSVTITPIPGTKTIQVLVYSKDNDESQSLKILNSIDGDSRVTLTYDTPNDYIGLYAACITGNNYYTLAEFKIGDKEVSFNSGTTRGTSTIDFKYTLPDVTPTLTGPIDSYGKKRGWNNVTLYGPSNEEELIMSVPDFDPGFARTMKQIIFSYFKNGRDYNNIELVKGSGYYNENAYPITTGEEPIIVSPIYRNDGNSNEVVNSELYYYYFKANEEPDLRNLKCYKAITMKNSMKGNDVLSRFHAYGLIYWDENGVGSFKFPAGYKIGFMLRSNLTQYNGQKQGEIWGDGRMNNELNRYGHFKSSGLGDNDPRMTWLTVNGKSLLCVESGTDKDVNDVIFQILGSIEPIDIPPYIEKNSYTFCFEDTFSGDYDMNDVIIKGERIDNTHVQWTLRASGANDELYLQGVNGQKINGGTEVHKIFGSDERIFINTESHNFPYVTDITTVSTGFSFLNRDNQPFLENRTKGYTVCISRAGEGPHGIMIPTDFAWPKEKVRIDYAYREFGNWGRNMIESTDWYLYPEESLVINP